MKTFSYEIKDRIGMHARPAGLLVKEAMKYNSRIVVKSGEKSAEATKLMALMALGIRQGQVIEVSVEGEDEDVAFVGIKDFLEQNL